MFAMLVFHDLCTYEILFPSFAGSLPPSPADSGVSDVDSSSSGHTSNDETKARLQPTPGKNMWYCCTIALIAVQTSGFSV